MIRVLLFLALVALLAFGVVWFADRPGDVAIVWQGYRIETSVMVAVVAVAHRRAARRHGLVDRAHHPALARPDRDVPEPPPRRARLSRDLARPDRGRRRRRGAAKRAADEAERIAPGEPLALLLNAQVAQLSGDRAAAEHAFRAMAERDDTKLLGLRGLYIEAQRRKDIAAARAYAEEAANAAPALGWAGQAVLEFRCAAGDWAARACGARSQQPLRPDRQGRIQAPARGAADRARARRRGRRARPRPLARARCA